MPGKGGQNGAGSPLLEMSGSGCVDLELERVLLFGVRVDWREKMW